MGVGLDFSYDDSEDVEEYIPFISLQREDKADDSAETDENDNEEHVNKSRGEFPQSRRVVWLYVRIIVVTSWISMVISVLLGAASMVLSTECNSPAAFGFAIDCVIDVASSAVMIWRFSGYHGNLNEDESERITLVSLGALFLVSGVVIVVNSVPDLIKGVQFVESSSSSLNTQEIIEEYVAERDLCENKWTLMIAITSMCCFIMITTVLTYIGYQLRSKSIQSDGFISLVNVVTSFTWLISMTTMKFFPHLWYLEDSMGILIAIFCFCYGSWLISELINIIWNGRRKQQQRK
ncbi:transmembrane protein 163a-like isoform X2 [Apostichopus japonicus]|uniref:transmembrane protein 163a-like isoform X2 n=1 Tax=Stichopus japonicus TaxID=307972 RepID=UPI003AB1F422